MSETQKQSEASTWYETIFASLDFSESLKEGVLDLDTEPKWVLNVLRELLQQTMPAFPFRNLKQITPRAVGRCIGQQRANMVAVAGSMEKMFAPENIVRGQAWLEMLQKNESNPAVKGFLEGPAFASLLQQVDCMIKLLEPAATSEERFNIVAGEAFKIAWDQPNHLETVAFFQGVAEGLSKPGIKERSLARATTATPIYHRLFIHRREIEGLASVRELRKFIVERGLSEAVLGDPKRLEKLCERIELSFAKPGRPNTGK